MLSVEDVHGVRARRAGVNHETYKQLYESVCERIRYHAEFDQDCSSLWYTVPPFVVGRPLYDREHALRYVFDKLTYHGFRVTRQNHSLFIDWTPQPTRRRRRQRPVPKIPKPQKPQPPLQQPQPPQKSHTSSQPERATAEITRDVRSQLSRLKSKYVKS